MGMFVDTNGIPISYKLFPGNNTDPITYIPAIEQIKKQFGIERVVTVADKAMNSAKNITATNNVGDGWIFSSKIRGSRGTPKDLQEFALSEQGWEYNHEGTFAKKSKIRKRKLSAGKTVSEKIVVTWNEKYDAREKQRRKGAVEYAAKLTNSELFRQTAKRGGKKYLELEYIDPVTGDKKPFNPFISIDYKQVEEGSKFDGLNVLVTSELDMSDEEIIGSYRQLHKIEDCFRVTKTDLSARPVYVWTDVHIQAHFLTCFISLTFLRYIKFMLSNRFSEERIITALKSANCISYDNGYCRVEANDDLQEINRIIGIEFKMQNIEEEKLNKYSRNWCTTFLKQEKK
jgi:transposase